MKQRFTVVITREGDWYVAQCLEVDVASQGESEQEAIQKLYETHEHIRVTDVKPGWSA